MEIFNTVVLAISGLLFLMVGSLRISNPIKNYAKNSGIKLEKEVNLLNEVRGTSAVMLSGGIIILLGIIIPKLTFTSFVIAILIFIGFAIGRILSIFLDGKPNKLILQGLIFELVLGSLNIFCLLGS
ncbi:DUF4345 domain-containing protein [Aureispira anguillae]|uniref:DUF4345 domain-containing protein n=1 Tax=Aureispira anguillae TaxID=2864201 RepID=A0A915YE84_9BACT|nr:DUF4345 domain-containing protein [Aureispira anguillae]BDS11437.1 DUF4345 domain-containing protein [Aureispira anguillae]